jgi:two-component system, NtrC family, sensor kinase
LADCRFERINKLAKNLKSLSISSRISIILGIIILLAMSLFSTFSLVKQKNDAISSISNNTQQLGKTIEKILRFSMLKNRRTEISLAVNNIINTEGITSARILDHRGVIHFSSRKTELDKNISNNNPLCVECHNENESRNERSDKNFDRYRINEDESLIYYSLPIYNSAGCSNSNCHVSSETTDTPPDTSKVSNDIVSVHDSSQTILGFIEIEVSIKKVISNLEVTRRQLIVLTVLFALLASVITYFSIRHLVGKPVKELVDGTNRVARGEFEQDISPGKAELGILAESFNRMQKQLLSTQSQLIESEKYASIGKIANEISNEINNPLTGIIIYSENLTEESSTKSIKDDCDLIRNEALKIRESIRNILSLTRQEKPEFKIINISETINRAIYVVKKFSNFRNIKIITAIPETLPAISADAALMEQVFLNLLLLSSDSMLTGGILNISSSFNEEKKEIEIIFSDTGKGISDNILHNVFESSQTSDIKNFEMTGISLTVCKDIIQMHRGSIKISTEGPGTSAIITLPV